MKKRNKSFIDIEIDKLTNSIENTVSGDIFDTEIIHLSSHGFKQINESDWLFDWRDQLKLADRETYKLVIKDNPNIIQGLVSLTDRNDHIFMHLIESAKFKL